MSREERQEKFIILANKRHNNKYDYSKVVYNGDKANIIIICPGIFYKNCYY